MISLLKTVLLAVTLLAAGPPAPPTILRVMTFNIHAGQGDLTRTAAVIRAAAPDVVALQEVDVHWSERSDFRDQAAALATATGMDVRFGPIYSLPSEAPGHALREYGVAILSRVPIVASRNHPITRLSTQSDAEPRPMPGFLQVTVLAGGRAVDVFSTHLDFRPDPAVRRAQVAEMLAVMERSTRPAVLLGDLNAPPDAEELQPLFLRLGDAWTAADRAARDAAPSGFTYPAEAPVRRIDYVLVTPDIGVAAARVIPTDASDHRPVVAELEIPGR